MLPDLKAAIYTRLSSDPDGTSTACERQESDARAYADAHGWIVVTTYRDNDVSAFDRRKKRPEFERLLGDLGSGEVETVIVWKSDRLARQPRDLERFLDAAEARSVALVSVTEPQFSGSSGLLILRLLVAFASHESSVKAERIQRKKRELAERGDDGGGPRPFGYRRTQRGLVIDKSEAKEIRAALRGILSGLTTQSDVARDWTARKVGDRRWSATTVLQVLRAPRLAARRVHHGQVVGDATWKPIISVEDHERVRVLSETRRKGARESRAPYLLAGIARCALCERNLSARADGYYGCSKGGGGCGGISVRREFADAEVERRFLAIVGDPDVMARLEVPVAPDTTPLVEALRRAEDRVAEIATSYGDGRLWFEEFRPAADAARQRVEQAREALANAVRVDVIEPPDRDAILARWDHSDVYERRRWLSSLVRSVSVARSRVPSRKGFDRSRISVTWQWSALTKMAETFEGWSDAEIKSVEERVMSEWNREALEVV